MNLINTLKKEIFINEKENYLKTISFYFVFIVLIIVIFILKLNILLQSSHPTGLDGYYYALQAKSLIQTGALENPDYKLGYYLCALFSKLFNNVILGCKIWASLACTLLSVSIFILVKTFSNKKIYPAFIAFILSGFLSPSIGSFQVNYINNLTGLFNFFFFASCFYYLISNFKTISKKNKILFITLNSCFFIASCLSHMVSLAYCFIFICIVLIRKLKPKKQIILLLLSSILFSILFISQIQRFRNVFSFTPILPVLSTKLINLTSKSICIEFSIYFVLSYIVSILYFIKTKKFDLFLLIPLITSFPFWNLSEIDMGYRMILNGLTVNIAYILILIPKIIENYKVPNFCKNRIIYTLLIIVIISFSFFIDKTQIYNPKKDPPYEYYKKLVQKIDLPKDSLLIAHLGLNHCYTYYCDLKDCLNYNCDFEVPNNEVWRLAYHVNADYIKAFFGDYEETELNKLIIQLDNNYTLIKEDLWQNYLKWEDDEIVDSLNNWFNPHSYRPSFIRKK